MTRYYYIENNTQLEIPAKDGKQLLDENKTFFTPGVDGNGERTITFDKTRTSALPLAKFLQDLNGIGSAPTSNFGLIVGIVVGILILLVIIGFFIFNKKENNETVNKVSPIVSIGTPTSIAPVVINNNTGAITTISPKTLSGQTNEQIINSNEIQKQKLTQENELLKCQNDVQYFNIELEDLGRYNDKLVKEKNNLSNDLKNVTDLLNQSKELIKQEQAKNTEKDQIYKYIGKEIISLCDKTNNQKCKDLIYKYYNNN